MGAQKVLVEGSSVTASQMQDFFRQTADGSINGRLFQMFLDHQLKFDLEKVVVDWGQVYKTLGMQTEYKAWQNVPTVVEDPICWDVHVVQGVIPNRVITAFRELGVKVETYVADLDGNVPTNDRDPKNGSYCARFKKTIEADPELANKSANDLAEEKIPGITLLERLLLELGYFLATGEHLDIENVTLCTGSRCSGGLVPSVHWDAGHRALYVDWYA